MPVNITDVSTFTDPLARPVDSDPANLTHLTPLFQGLANRSRWLANLLGGIAGSGEWSYPSARSRVFLPELTMLQEADSSWVSISNGRAWRTNVAGDDASFRFRVPHGMTITQVRVFVLQSTTDTGTDRLSATLHRASVASFPTSAPTGTVIGALTYANGNASVNGGRDAITWSGLSEVCDAATEYFVVEVVSSQQANVAGDVVYAVEVTGTVAGPPTH